MITTQPHNYNPSVKISSVLPSVVDTPTKKKSLLGIDLNREYQKAINQICKEKGYRGAKEKILKQITYRLDLQCESYVGQKKLSQETGYSLSSVERAYKQFVSDGLLAYERQGTWLQRLSNKTIMLCLKHLLPSVPVKMTGNINTLNPNLGDLKNYNTYTEYVSILDKSEKKDLTRFPTDKRKANVKIVSDKALQEAPEEEITRFCLAYMLTQQDICYVKEVMRAKQNLKSPSGFLADMVKKLSRGLWKKILPSIPIPEWREVEKAQEYKNAQPETFDGVEAMKKIRGMLGFMERN